MNNSHMHFCCVCTEYVQNSHLLGFLLFIKSATKSNFSTKGQFYVNIIGKIKVFVVTAYCFQSKTYQRG